MYKNYHKTHKHKACYIYNIAKSMIKMKYLRYLYHSLKLQMLCKRMDISIMLKAPCSVSLCVPSSLSPSGRPPRSWAAPGDTPAPPSPC